MKVLADTHLILWALTGDAKLPEEARVIMANATNSVFCSAASVWEVAIKHMSRPDKIMMSGSDMIAKCQQAGFVFLPIQPNHIQALEKLIKRDDAPPHNDPFDRILIAQAKAEGMMLITHDSLIPYYTEDCIKFV